MKKKLGIVLLLTAVSASAALGATNVTIKVTDAGSNIIGDYYIGPYQALVNGVPTQVICDDYLADTQVDVPWTATQLSVADLSNPANLAATRWGVPNDTATLAKYEQAAWLAIALDSWTSSTPCLTGNCQADLQFAIWSLFNPTAYTYYADNSSSIHPLAVDAWLADSAAHYSDAGIDYSKVLIYTPNPIVGGPQEFLSVVHTPEPTATALLGFQGLGVVAFVYFIRRRSAAQKA